MTQATRSSSKKEGGMSANPFVVRVAKLRRTTGTRWHEVLSGVIDDLACSGSAVPAGSDVEADLVLESVLGGLAVTGSVVAPWVGQCRRCLAPASGVLKVRVLEHFTEGGDGSDTYALVNDEIDLEPMLHDVLLLELPMAPLCAQGCKGICPNCGANRNDEPCSCDDSPVDPRWAALAALKFGESDGPDEPEAK